MRVVVGLGRWLMREAVAAIAPVVAGCAGVLIGRQVGNSAVGRMIGQHLEGALDYFGRRIVARWLEFFEQEPATAQRSLEELAQIPPEAARQEAELALDQLDVHLVEADRQAALDYLTAIPQILSRTLAQAARAGLETQDAGVLLRLLPADVPPYASPCPLPGTTYRLEELAGLGGFGSVYRAVDPRMPYLPLALKFCRDASAIPILRRERDNLERLLQANPAEWSPRVVRLCGYDLDHATPYLVYEWVPGGDLATLLDSRTTPPEPKLVLSWMRGILEGLAFAHRRGVVHRDLKPANILIAPDGIKVTDFGIGTITRTAENANPTRSLLRGAGTPRYMAPEQRRGAPADPRHDLYSVGVLWYQCLLGDTCAEIHPGWEDELRETVAAPEGQIAAIRRCVGTLSQRPTDAGALLALLEEQETSADAVPPALVEQVTRLHEAHQQMAGAATLHWTRHVLLLLGAFVAFELVAGLAIAVPVVLLEDYGDRSWRHWTPLLVIPGSILSFWLAYVAWRWLRNRLVARRTAGFLGEVTTQADQLQANFPEAVAAWGGREMLLDGEAVERLCLQLQARARRSRSEPARRDVSRWKPTPATRPAPNATNTVISPNPHLQQELFHQYRAALKAVEKAQVSPPWVRTAMTFIAIYSGMIGLGVLVALPVVFLALYGGLWERAVGIPVVSLIGASLAGGISYGLTRWFHRWQRSRRVAGPTQELSARVELLARAYPAEISVLGGTGVLTDPRTGSTACARLEVLLDSPLSPTNP